MPVIVKVIGWVVICLLDAYWGLLATKHVPAPSNILLLSLASLPLATGALAIIHPGAENISTKL